MNLNVKKFFTVSEANCTLPLVRRIVKDILDVSHEARTLALLVGDDAQNHPQLASMMESLKKHFAELEEIGCFYKDWNFSMGLVDFPAIIDDEEVFLCWRSDEDAILYYHKMNIGYTGRKQIPDKYLV